MFYFQWEFSLLDGLQNLHGSVLDSIMTAITFLGNAGIFWIFAGIGMLFFKKTRKCGITVLIALLFSLLVCNLALKNLVARQRPCWIRPDIPLLITNPSDFSFPSGHSQASFAAATAIFQNHKKLGIGAFVLAGLIAFSRLYLYVHFPTDVFVGAIIGCVLGWAADRIVCHLWATKSFLQ